MPHESPSGPRLSGSAALSVDPTRTLTLRRGFESDMKRRFSFLSRAVRTKIESGVVDVDELSSWLDSQVEIILLSVNYARSVFSLAPSGRWTDRYIQLAYNRGMTRATVELNRVGIQTRNLRVNVRGPLGSLSILMSKVYAELRGIAQVVKQKIIRTFSDGLLAETPTSKLAARISKVIKGVFVSNARPLTHAEIVRAHHNAMMDEYEKYGISQFRVRAEWVTAGDGNVCSRCADMEGRVFSLDEIRELIPYHPFCRCLALPIV